MKVKTVIISLSFLICFPSLGFAKSELSMFKEKLNWASWDGRAGDKACFETIIIKEGRNVPDMGNEPCQYTEGKYSITLTGPPGTTVTFFGLYDFQKENGFLTIRKIDERMLWLLDLTSFPDGQWHTSEANNGSGAFEAFYSASPTFEQSVFSVKWGQEAQ